MKNKKELKVKKRQEGFTLVELIVVMAILAVLVAIALPRYTDFAREAQIKADMVSAKIIANAVTVAFVEKAGERPTTDEINKLLNDIAITVDTTAPETGWSVVFDATDTNKFTVYKDGNQKYPQ